MPLYLGTDNAGTNEFSLQDFEPSSGAKLSAAVREAWLESYGPVATDYVNSRMRNNDGDKLSADEAASAIKESGAKTKLAPKDGEYTRAQLDILTGRALELTAVKDVRDRTPWSMGSPVRGAAMFAAGIVDPINLATAFVPWTKSISALNAARAAAVGAETFAARTGARAALGAADAGIQTAVMEPAFYAVRNQLGDDYSAMDSISNIAFGAAFGGGIHAIGGAAGDAMRGYRARPEATFTPNPMATESAPPAGAAMGGETFVRVGDAREPAQFAVVESDSLRATVDKADNQFRDRSRAAYQTEIQARANSLDPAMVLSTDNPLMDVGTPTIATDGRIIGGNGRTLFIDKAYEIGKGADYRAALEAKLQSLGIDPASVQGMKKPVLVRRLQREVDVKQAAMLSNEGGSTDMSALEQSKVDAERLGDSKLSVAADGDLQGVENRAAIRKWVEAQPENKRNSLVDEDGKLSAEGIRRLNGALLYKAYGDSPTLGRLIESMDVGSRNLAMALGRTAPVIANAREAVRAGDLHPLDIAGDVQQAVEKYNQLRTQGAKVGDYLAQIDAFGDGMTPEALRLLEFMGDNIASPRRIAEAITGFYDRLNEAGNPKQGDLLGGSGAPDKLGMVEASIKAAEQRADTAADVVAALAPETREAALRASVAQSVDGRAVDVEAIVGMDESRGMSNLKDAQAAAERNMQAEEKPLADFDASRRVEQRVKEAPRNWALDDANTAAADADALLAETVKAGDQAFKYARETAAPVKAPEGITIKEVEDGFEAFDADGNRVGYLRDNLPRGAAEALDENANVDIVKVDPAMKGAGVGRALYDAFNEKHGGRIAPSGKTSPDAWKLWKRSYPEKVDAFVEMEALRIREGADSSLVIGNITDKDVAQRVAKAVTNPGEGQRYSLGAMYGEGAPEALTQSLRESFGASTDAMIEAGQIKVVNTPGQIPGGPHPGDVKAATTKDGVVYVVASNVTPAEARGMVLHEVGVHVGMERMLGPELFQDVLKNLDDAIGSGSEWAQAARSSVPADTPAHLVREEQLAYLVQHSPDLPIVQRIIAAVREWVYRNFEFARERMTLTEADLRSMATSALHSVARGDGGAAKSAFSRDVAQVGTKAFADWFGASKVVDADGKPVVVYHGTKGSFSVFDYGRIGEQGRAEGAGFYFTTDKQVASGYGTPLETYLSITKPLPYDAKGFSQATVAKIVRRVAELEAEADGVDIGDGFLSNYGDTYSGGIDRVVREAAKLIAADEKAIDQLSGIVGSGVNPEYVNRATRDVTGHDGVVAKGFSNSGDASNTIYVAFFPEQIKSATDNNGQFSPDNPDIRYARGETPDPSTGADELKPYNEAVARAKQFASVLRAAADKLGNDAAAAEAMRAAMPDISGAEIKDLLDQLRQSVKGLRGVSRSARDVIGAEDAASGLQFEAMQAADELANNLELAAVIEKRNASLNMNVRLKAGSFVNQFRDAKLDVEGFRGLLVGTERKRAGGRLSVDAEQKNFKGEWLGGMLADLEKSGLNEAFVSGKFDRDTYQALWNMSREGADNSKLPKEAVQMAEIISKYQTDARNTRNRFGAWIRDLQGYVVRQSHDMYKIRDAGEKAWVDAVMPKLDIPKMQKLGLITEGDVRGSLAGMYDDFAAGTHMKPETGETDTAAFGTGSSLAKKESQSRTLYFKDGNAAFEYNEAFGVGRLADSVLNGLDHAAKSAGLMKVLGTNPEANLGRIFDQYAESLRGDPARRAKFMSSRKEIMENLLHTVDGTANIPASATAAKIGSFFRSWESLAKLGGALISSISDLANYAAELRFGQDKNLFSGTLDGIGALTRGRAKGEQLQILASLGVFHESVVGSVNARFDSPEMSGKMAATMQMYFKLNGLTWWTESLRDGYALQHSNYLASNVASKFEKLPDALRDMLGLYNIDAGKWDILRMAATKEADGRKYMTPEGLKTVPVAALENYITQVGRTVSDAAVLNLQDDLASALRTMTIDRMHHAVIEPNARSRAFMQRGTQPGTVPGELLRYIGQFKSFPVAMVQMTLGREIYGRGYDTLGDYLKNGKGDMLGLATYIGLTTAMGYAAMSIKDLIKGRNPRPVADPRTFAAAMVQGGGLGIYGDFLFAKYNKMGNTFSGSLAGPALNTIDTAFDLYNRGVAAAKGELMNEKSPDFKASAFNAVLQNTPFMNLFYTRVALDYLILYRIQEALNPGFLRRMEQRAQKENGQTFYLPPSHVVN